MAVLKIKFLTDYLTYKKGDVKQIEKMQARYYINIGKAELYKRATKELKIKLETK